jgi:hypothetical protein
MVPVDKEAERRRDPRSYVFGFGRRFVLLLFPTNAITGLMIPIDAAPERFWSTRLCG